MIWHRLERTHSFVLFEETMAPQRRDRKYTFTHTNFGLAAFPPMGVPTDTWSSLDLRTLGIRKSTSLMEDQGIDEEHEIPHFEGKFAPC
jgi:hypothetical protein